MALPEHGDRVPDRTPDFEVARDTLDQQALLYRLATGDKNPLDTLTSFLRKAGGLRPPDPARPVQLRDHRGRRAVDAALGGKVDEVARYQARFAGVVFPGNTYSVIRGWRNGERILLDAFAEERGSP